MVAGKPPPVQIAKSSSSSWGKLQQNVVKNAVQKRAPIRKGRSKFGDRLRRSSAMSMSKAKKEAGHRDLQLEKAKKSKEEK